MNLHVGILKKFFIFGHLFFLAIYFHLSEILRKTAEFSAHPFFRVFKFFLKFAIRTKKKFGRTKIVQVFIKKMIFESAGTKNFDRMRLGDRGGNCPHGFSHVTTRITPTCNFCNVRELSDNIRKEGSHPPQVILHI